MAQTSRALDGNDFSDLKGKVLAVDAPTARYAIAMIYMLKQHGLELNRTFKAFGSTTKRRRR